MKEFGFKSYHDVSRRKTIADLFKPKRRSGIYLLYFQNGEYYVGQSRDVVRRFNQHKQNYEDIVGLSFQRTPIYKMNATETSIIGQLEARNIPLRNVSLTSTPPVESDLDLIVSTEYQSKWLADQVIVDDSDRIDDEQQRRKYSKKFKELLEVPTFMTNVLPFLKKYIEQSIICPNRTEMSFWSISCLPVKEKNYRLFLRININKQEVLTIGENKESIFFSFHSTDSIFTHLSDEEVEQRYFKEFSTFSVEDHFYKSGGADQVKIVLADSKEAISVLDDQYFVKSVKLMNYRLMKKGPTYFNRYHCLQIVDLVR